MALCRWFSLNITFDDISTIFNLCCSLSVYALLIFAIGKSNWCDNKNAATSDFCEAFAGALGIFFIFLLLIALCIAPCTVDYMISLLILFLKKKTKKTKKLKESSFYKFDSKYRKMAEYYKNKRKEKKPIIYHPKYNITALGIEKLHPFDSCKYKRIYEKLVEKKIFNENEFLKNK